MTDGKRELLFRNARHWEVRRDESWLSQEPAAAANKWIGTALSLVPLGQGFQDL